MGILKKIFGPSKPKVHPVALTDANFGEEILSHKGVAMVDIWGDNCPPCKQLEPVIMRIANDYADRGVKVGELRVATGQQTAGQYKVRGTPTVLYFVDGKVVDRVVGFKGSLYHRQTLDALLEGRPPGDA